MLRHRFTVVLANPAWRRPFRVSLGRRSLRVLALAAALCGLAVSDCALAYLRMLARVSRYNTLAAERRAIGRRYAELNGALQAADQELATLQLLPMEVSSAYGVAPVSGPADEELQPDTPAARARFELLRSARIAAVSLKDMAGAPAGWPVRGPVGSGFGARQAPSSGEPALHTGVDIIAARGTEVRATAAGTVAEAGPSGDYGNTVTVRHSGGYQTLYAHLSRIDVFSGEVVEAGQLLGAVGTSGNATGAHLHYEVRIGGIPVDPARYLGAPHARPGGGTVEAGEAAGAGF